MPYTLSPVIDDDAAPEVETDGENRWTLNFGPQHPATHTTLRVVLELDGERVVKCTPHIGYLHSGFEKLGEHLNYNQYVTIVDRMDYSAPIYNELAWHLATEKLMGIELTPRCKVLRTIANELGRIQSHICFASARPAWIWARSPRFSTASTNAKRSTTSSST
jgi:NADH-quinone oxidoreductase subunit D